MAQQAKSRSAAATRAGNGASATGKKTATNGKTNRSGEQPQMGEELEKFFLDAIKDIYWAEKHLVKALPKMAKAATSEELQNAFQEHRDQTEEHVSRLEQVFEHMGKKAQAKKCDAMEGLLKEADGIIEETEAGTHTRDVALIMAAQKVEHYEIATYGGLATLANTFGLTEVAELFQQTLDEEKETDETLTSIAENDINYEAGTEDDSEEEEEE